MLLKNRLIYVFKSNQTLVVNILASGGIKGLAVLINVLTVPAYMNYFSDSSVLGVWLTFISILTTVSVLDLGLGNGLRNKLAATFAVGDIKTSKKLISSGYYIVAIICICVFLAGIIIIPFCGWNKILGISNEILRHKELVRCIVIVYTSVVIQILLKMITSVLYAQQKSALVSLLPVLTNTLMLLFVLVFPRGTAEKNLLLLSIVYFISSNLPYLIVTCVLFGGKYRELRPGKDAFRKEEAKSILSLGIKFFYLSLMSMMVHNTNEILISALFDSSMVVDYQIYNKIFYLITTVINVLMIPLWSAVTKALSNMEYKWIKRLHITLCCTSGIALLCGLGIIPFMQMIVNIWLGSNSIQINSTYCIPFAIYVALEAWNGANATIANGTGWIKSQMIMAPITALLNIVLTIVFKNILNSWIAIQVSNIFSLMPVAIVQFIYIKQKIRYVLYKERLEVMTIHEE